MIHSTNTQQTSMSDETINLVSSDGEKYTMTRQAAGLSKYLGTVLSNTEETEHSCVCSGMVLQLVVKYLQIHNGVEPMPIDKPIKSKNMAHICDKKEDAILIDSVEEKQLLEFLLAANWMGIPSLVDLVLAKIATIATGNPISKLESILTREAF